MLGLNITITELKNKNGNKQTKQTQKRDPKKDTETEKSIREFKFS